MDKISQYDYMEAVTPAPSYEPEPPEDEALAVAASMVREALRLVADVTLSDSTNGRILLARMSGMSLAEIGSRLGMTKQAVHKRVITIAYNWPALASALTDSAPVDDVAVDISLMKTLEETRKIRQEATQWMNKPN